MTQGDRHAIQSDTFRTRPRARARPREPELYRGRRTRTRTTTRGGNCRNLANNATCFRIPTSPFLFSVISHLSSALCPLFSVFCHLFLSPSVIGIWISVELICNAKRLHHPACLFEVGRKIDFTPLKPVGSKRPYRHRLGHLCDYRQVPFLICRRVTHGVIKGAAQHQRSLSSKQNHPD